MDQATREYVHELRAILACDQSDGYLKMWAKERLDQMKNPFSMIPVSKRELTTIS